MNKSIIGLFTTAAFTLSAPAISEVKPATPETVVAHYATIAHAVFEDAHLTAQNLASKIDALLNAPSAENLAAAKSAWIDARVPYQQSEVFRFGNANVDDWEGQLNAWPLDEGLIDYVSSNYEHEMGNVGATANIINNTSLTLGSETLDIVEITPELLASLNELGGSEANVATGYHAIEFLLWGQDLNGTGPGAGNRPFTDYVLGEGCTNGHCDRRRAYLEAVTALLISDLNNMVQQWAPNQDNYRKDLLADDPKVTLGKMFYGMGSLSLGELAGERMKVALEANSPEDEHDCFSDNTHHSHYYNALGIKNIYLGEYKRVDGTRLSGPSIADLVAAKQTELNKQTTAALESTDNALMKIVKRAEDTKNPLKFDQMISAGNTEGKQLVTNGIESLVEQTKLIAQAANAIGVSDLNPDSAGHDF